MDAAWIDSFREKLETHHTWPTVYIFKFIVPKGKLDDLLQLFPLHSSTEKVSKNGNYISLTFQMTVPSSNAVIEVYEKASVIEGIIAL